jgi:hypothetical protein
MRVHPFPESPRACIAAALGTGESIAGPAQPSLRLRGGIAARGTFRWSSDRLCNEQQSERFRRTVAAKRRERRHRILRLIKELRLLPDTRIRERSERMAARRSR